VVIISAEGTHYHRPKKGFYTQCGADFNPHHAVTIERQKAERLGYRPCEECGLEDDHTLGEYRGV